MDVQGGAWPAVICEVLEAKKYWTTGSLSLDLDQAHLTGADMINC